MTPTVDQSQRIETPLERETARVYTPVVRITLAMIAAYYGVVTINHFTSGETGTALVSMVGLSATSVFFAALLNFSLKDNPSISALERAGLIGNVLITANLLLFYAFHYDPNRLVYFVMMVFVFAMTGATRRVSTVSSAAALAALYTVIAIYDPTLIQQYIYIGVASSFVALGCTILFHRIIQEALDAKLLAVEQEAEAIGAATHDALTGLPNRRHFYEHLDRLKDTGSENGKGLAVLMVDLDGFKPLNDTYGHATGDRLLVTAGQRLSMAVPEDVFVARIGGDEFSILVPAETPEEAAELGDRLCAELRKPFELGSITVHAGATVGVAFGDPQSTDVNDLVQQADFALLSAKRKTKGRSVVFTAEDGALMRRRVVVEQALRRCDLKKELTVFYQPQVDIRANRITGCEVLARWSSQELGFVDPGTFISVAETSGMIHEITQVLLAKALADARTWPVDLDLAFNLSVHDILDEASIDKILSMSKRSGIAPERICFEITETVMMTDLGAALSSLNKLVAAGHRIALDDFGTGYSSLSLLHKLPIDKIKIDKSFLRDLPDMSSSAKVVSMLMQMTRSLGKECVIEGVETELELAAMQSLGARQIQGYYFAKPMPAGDFEIFHGQYVLPSQKSATSR